MLEDKIAFFFVRTKVSASSSSQLRRSSFVLKQFEGGLFALVTRQPYCPGRPKKLCFTTLSLTPMVSTARLSVVKQSFSSLLGQYGRHVTRANW